MTAFFIHGAGRSGHEAWPLQAADMECADFHFVGSIAKSNDPHLTAAAVGALMSEPGHVVAHSYGAIAAFLLAERHPDLVRSLVLFEPATLALARGRTAVEAHIAAMTPVFELCEDATLSGRAFAERFLNAMGVAPKGAADELEAKGTLLRAIVPPWEFDVDLTVPSRIPTLVVTGAGAPMYGEIAAVLANEGAAHLVLEGTGHRPQDHPRAVERMKAFWLKSVTQSVI
ncbi:alpha/beta hydrolase [Glycomyces luteolus]|uniref:Alpha/beta hydrolase n=1 Tax=Glycomyces luteolus TaxID=2670330 RepID=A0A9X3P7S5_9ACTN|nr:alpha/beta hydrolase [Glycomyces luteolus]MDA1359857.1 alpha/beta hydrolase [Glycomyces luteolus]